MSSKLATPQKHWLVMPALGLLLALALIVGLAAAAGVEPTKVIATMHRLPLWSWALIAFGQAALIFFAALKWRLVLDATVPSVPSIGRGEATAATALGTLAGQVMPIQLVTPVMRAWIARRRAIPVPVALGTSALEQAFDLAVLVMAGSISGVFLSVALSPSGSPRTAVLVVLALLAGLTFAARAVGRLTGRIVRAAAGCRAGLAAKLFENLARGIDVAATLDRRSFVLLALLSAMRIVLLAALNIGVLRLLAPDASLLTITLAFPIVLIVNAAPIFPGGLGAAEFTWSGALVLAGVSPVASVATALALRVMLTCGFLVTVPLLLSPLAVPGRIWRLVPA